MHDLIALRRANRELGPAGSLEVLHDGYPLAYLRGGRFLVVINPSGRRIELRHERAALAGAGRIRGGGITVDASSLAAEPFAYGIFEL